MVYCRYVDDIFLYVSNIATLETIKSKFEDSSVLNFTYEIENNKCISFLDVNVKKGDNKLETSVNVKKTHSGDCINFRSIAPERYKIGVIKTMINRAYLICSTYQSLHQELERLQQLFTNNKFPLDLVQKEINRYLEKKSSLQILPKTQL